MPDVDPLSVLRRTVVPVAPGPRFTHDLRARLVAALRSTEGENVMTVMDTPTQTRVPRPGALPYLAVRGAAAAIDFYRSAFGAELIGDPYVMGDGRIGHAELAMGGGVVYLADEFPDIGVVAPSADGTPVSLMIAVEDTDASIERFRSAGGRVVREAFENYGARGATVIDPFGHRWMLSGPILTPATAAGEAIRPGDLGYVSWWTPDADRAAAFYGRVLGWPYDTGSGARHTRDTSIPTGIDGGHATSGLFCCYAVESADAAVDAIREAGGQAAEITEEAFGRSAMGVDPAGLPFAVYEPAAGSVRPPINGERPGDLEYVTYQTPSSQVFRDFYGAVLGWTFNPGRIEDGWEPVDVAPMSGLHGSDGPPVIVPMWRVADVVAAAQVVVDAGGRVIEAPQRQPYGMSALCEDDQGGRFYLGDG